MRIIYIYLVFIINLITCFSENCDSIKKYDAEYLKWKKHGFYTSNYDIDSTMKQLPCYFSQFSSINSIDISNTCIEVWPDFLFKTSGITNISISNISKIEPFKILSKLHLIKKLKDLTLKNVKIDRNKFILSDNLENIRLINISSIGLPFIIDNPTALDLLIIDDSTFSIIDSSFKKYVNMTILHINNSKLCTLPEFFYNMDRLKVVSLNNNNFNNPFQVLKRISKMKNVQQLGFCKNKLKNIPPEVYKMDLKDLFLDSNEIKIISAEIGKFTKLERLGLSNNKITSFPNSLGKIRNSLKELYIEGNKLSEGERNKIKKLLPHTKIYFE